MHILPDKGRYYLYLIVHVRTGIVSGKEEPRVTWDNDDQNRFVKKRPNEAVYCSRTLLATVLICVLVLSGCLSVSPSVRIATNDSAVFDELTIDEPWASNHVWVNTTFTSTPSASNVTTVSVIQENGRVFSTQQVVSGQTNVLLALPTNQNATLVASNAANSTTIEKTNISITGIDPFSQ